jgi:uncharacterized protein with HEPN domain
MQVGYRRAPSSLAAQDAVIRNFEVIGEASRNLLRYCPEFVKAHSGLPLIAAYEMRNHLAHGYFRVSLGLVWKTVCEDPPALRREMQAAALSVAALESGKADGRGGSAEGPRDPAIGDDPVDL